MAARSSIVDYYKELGLNRFATSNDIRTAYKRLALRWHPDRNKAKDAEEKFKKIKQAYDVLIDEKRRKEYDQQQNTRSEKKPPPPTNMKSTQPHDDLFNLHTFENLMSNPIDPFDILNDIQFFQESDFTSKMMNSPSYRNFYTQIFNSMNNDPKNHRHMYSSSPIYLNNDRLFRSNRKSHSKPQSSSSSSKPPPINPIPVIHSTMANEWFLNELIDLHEQQNPTPSYSISFNNDLTHCTNCHKKISTDRTRLIQHEEQCRKNINQHTTIPSKSSVRV